MGGWGTALSPTAFLPLTYPFTRGSALYWFSSSREEMVVVVTVAASLQSASSPWSPWPKGEMGTFLSLPLPLSLYISFFPPSWLPHASCVGVVALQCAVVQTDEHLSHHHHPTPTTTVQQQLLSHLLPDRKSVV